MDDLQRRFFEDFFGRASLRIFLQRGPFLGLLKPNVFCMSMLRSMVIKDQFGFNRKNFFCLGQTKKRQNLQIFVATLIGFLINGAILWGET